MNTPEDISRWETDGGPPLPEKEKSMDTGNDRPRQSADVNAPDEPSVDNPDVKSKPADAPRNEMFPQDGTDRSLDEKRVRDELLRQWPNSDYVEKRDEDES